MCREALLAEDGLQALLQHLHHLLLPVINRATADHNQSQSQGLPAESPADCKQLLGLEQGDLDMLLAILEALAAADASSSSHVRAQVMQHSASSLGSFGHGCC